MTKYIILGLIFIAGFIYLLIPGPMSIGDIPGVPGAVKSDEPGDTYQNPNIAGYYGDKRRKFVTQFYQEAFEKLNFGSLPIPSIRLNHPPEEAFAYIRDQQKSTYLEQYLYPLRGYLFVNGYEPYDENGKRFDSGAYPLDYKGDIYPTKVTVRYYPVPFINRVLIYILYWIGGLVLFWLFKKVLREKN
jgi:hypothetical protein